MSERPSAEILDMLFDVIDSKRKDDPETSYTAQLLAAAPEKPARKLAEEATETFIEAIRGDSKALAQESADLLYHLLVVWAAAGLTPSDIWSILADRQRAFARQLIFKSILQIHCRGPHRDAVREISRSLPSLSRQSVRPLPRAHHQVTAARVTTHCDAQTNIIFLSRLRRTCRATQCGSVCVHAVTISKRLVNPGNAWKRTTDDETSSSCDLSGWQQTMQYNLSKMKAK